MLSTLVRFPLREAGALRSLSTVAKPDNAFAIHRAKYKEEMTGLRKEWMAAHKAKLQQLDEAKKAERQRVILKRAVKLRGFKVEKAVRKEKVHKIKEASAVKHREKLAATQIYVSEKQAVQKQRYELAAKDLEEEKDHWITLENMDAKITPALFDGPSTTGLTNKHSDLWRYQMFGMSLDRMMYMDKNKKSAYEFRRQLRFDNEVDKRMQVQDYLNSIIGTGQERAEFKSYVDEFVEVFHSKGTFNSHDELLEEELRTMDGDRFTEGEKYVYEADEDDAEMEQLPDLGDKKKDDGGRKKGPAFIRKKK